MFPSAFLRSSRRPATTLPVCTLFLPRLTLRHVSGPYRQLSRSGSISQNVCSVMPHSFRQQLALSRPATPFAERIRWKVTVGRHIWFAAAVSFSVFATAACYANMQTEFWLRNLQDHPQFKNALRPRSVDLSYVSFRWLHHRLQLWFDNTSAWLVKQSYTLLYRYHLVKSIQIFVNHHLKGRLRPETSTIFSTSLLVLVITRRWPGARRFFVHDPLSGRRYTLFTSIFSFKSFMGLLLAWWTMDNFAGTFVHESWIKDGRPGSFPEVNAAYHFLAFYISAGLFSGLVSHIVAARILYPAVISRSPLVKYIPRMFRRYPAASGGKPTGIPISGGGAGAVYACVTWEACTFPDGVLTLQEGFPNVWYLSSTAAVTMLIAWNLLGLKRGWGRFNHVANLAGAGFGAIYASYGLRFWDRMRAVYGPGPRTKASSSLSSSPLFRDVKKEND